MKVPRTLNFLIVLLLLVAGSVSASEPEPPAINPAAPQAIQAPVLKWRRGGCDSVECKTSWYSSPAVADVDNDGKMEVIAAADFLYVLGDNGTLTPTLKWQQDPLGLRVWPGVVVADIEGDGALEIVTAHGDGYVHVYDQGGRSSTLVTPANAGPGTALAGRLRFGRRRQIRDSRRGGCFDGNY